MTRRTALINSLFFAGVTMLVAACGSYGSRLLDVKLATAGKSTDTTVYVVDIENFDAVQCGTVQPLVLAEHPEVKEHLVKLAKVGGRSPLSTQLLPYRYYLFGERAGRLYWRQIHPGYDTNLTVDCGDNE